MNHSQYDAPQLQDNPILQWNSDTPVILRYCGPDSEPYSRPFSATGCYRRVL